MSQATSRFDAVLLIAFGGPTQPDEIRPFLEHVLRGRPVPPSRIDEVAHHYELIGGRSPLNDHTERQRAALETRLAELGTPLDVAMGMWHAKPFLLDVLRGLAAKGKRRIAGVVLASFYDTSTIGRYRAVIDEALAEIALPDLTVKYIDSPERHDGFITANVDYIRAAAASLPADPRLMFTAHSVPTAVGQSSGYVESFERAANSCATRLGIRDYRCVYQSRSGSPREPWLEPDVCAALRAEADGGTRAVILAPIGFVCDHVEVLYDLDVEAAAVARELGISLARASTCSVHPAYIGALADGIVRAAD